MPRITERADAFARKLRPQPEPDNRSPAEKMSSFLLKYDPQKAMKASRQKVKKYA